MKMDGDTAALTDRGRGTSLHIASGRRVVSSERRCIHCDYAIGPDRRCIVAVVKRGGSVHPFAAVKLAVMRGAECVANACSHTMAKRIANALNNHQPNQRGE